MKYNVKKGITGYRVHYHCPQCSTGLSNPLSEAGISDVCPDCGKAFIVPGVTEKQNLEAMRQREAQEKEKAKQAERIQKRADKAKAKAERQDMAKQERDWKRKAVEKTNYTPTITSAKHDAYRSRRDKAINPFVVLLLPGALCTSVVGWESKRYPSFALVINLVSMLVMLGSFVLSVVQYVILFGLMLALGSGEEAAAIAFAMHCFWIVGHIVVVAIYMGGIEMALMLADIEANTRKASNH